MVSPNELIGTGYTCLPTLSILGTCLPHHYHLSNRTFTPTLHHKSPFHRTPDYTYLKAFGCLCFPYLCPYNTTKLSYNSLPCVFIDYSTKHKWYLCLHQPLGRIYISTHIIFDESHFPFTTSPTPSSRP
ncbi:hypothetical protein V2J09_013849 [Rumex salicifolius]